MEKHTIYKLQPGDTIYLITIDREIKSITLTEDHLSLVGKFEHDYANQRPYYKNSGVLYRGKVEKIVSYGYRPVVKETNIWLLTNELTSQETEIPLYTIIKKDDEAQAMKLGTDDCSVFAFTTYELAQDKIRELMKLEVADKIAKAIDFVVISDSDNIPIEVFKYSDIRDWNSYIEKITDYNESPIIIKLTKGQTFTKEDFEAYVNEKFEEKLKETKK